MEERAFLELGPEGVGNPGLEGVLVIRAGKTEFPVAVGVADRSQR